MRRSSPSPVSGCEGVDKTCCRSKWRKKHSQHLLNKNFFRLLYLRVSSFNHSNDDTAVKSDALNHDHSKRLLGLLQLVTDNHQRLMLFEEVERALLDPGSHKLMREAAGILGGNLAEAMDKRGRHEADPAVQEAFLRHSIRIFPESSVASRSLGYKLEQSGQEEQAMDLYRNGLVRDPERPDLRLLLAASCSPFLNDTSEGKTRCIGRAGRGSNQKK